METILLNYGVLGVTTTGLSIFVLHLLKEHKKERDEWRRSNEIRSAKMEEAINNNTAMMIAVKSLVESLDRRTE